MKSSMMQAPAVDSLKYQLPDVIRGQNANIIYALLDQNVNKPSHI